MPPADKINFSEERYKLILEEFLSRIFTGSNLPSHGIDHHKRVWQYAKELLSHLQSRDFIFNQHFTDSLIIACYLHDAGLSVDSGPKHGNVSRHFGEQFIAENNLSYTEFDDALIAIENHDNKEYNLISKPEELLTVLSVADDLDAFGFIGIYRYLEIYIERKVPFKELGILINENAASRFRNFLSTYRFQDEFTMRHIGRYEILTEFFDSFSKQASNYRFEEHLYTGHCGIAEIISEMLTDRNPESNVFKLAASYPDPVIQWYFAWLNNELSGESLRLGKLKR